MTTSTGKHVWVQSIWLGNTVCQECGLLPLDEDDRESVCEGRDDE